MDPASFLASITPSNAIAGPILGLVVPRSTAAAAAVASAYPVARHAAAPSSNRRPFRTTADVAAF